MTERTRHWTRAAAVGLLAFAFAGTAAPAGAAPDPGPAPPGERLEGPPQAAVLAVDPSTVPAPEQQFRTQAAPCPAPGYGVNRSAPGGGRTVALTFDDGPGPSTDAIMDILTDAGVTATFFNIGVNEATRPDTVRAQADRGFLLGSHTWSHPDLTTLSSSAQATEMDRSRTQQANLVGAAPCFFRPPYGAYNSTTLELAQARNMSVWNWSVDTEDWKATSASSAWVDRIVSRARAGGSQTHPVVLMHNQPGGNPATVAALPAIIDFYRARGYTFVDLAGHTGNRMPIGSLDAVRADGAGQIAVGGWTIDPDTPTQPTRVHVYVDGQGAAAVTADGSRPDVGRHFPNAGDRHGFNAVVPAGPGQHTVCVYAIDTTTSGVHPTLGCRTVTITQRAPFGSLDVARAVGSGQIAVGGWTIDPDTPTQPTRVHVYLDGQGAAAVTADGSRPDVARHFPSAGDRHGFYAVVPATTGEHTVCVYMIDTTTSGVHPTLGCRTVGTP